MTDLSGKVVMVVGGSRGIGAAIVSSCTEAGGSVRFTYAESEAAATALSAKTGAAAIRCDSLDRDALLAVIRDAGPIDVFVYNAGVCIGGNPLKMDSADVDRMIEVNVRSAYFATVEAARHMPDGGRIILIGSVHGDRIPFPGLTVYAMTKSALQGMARGLARDFGPRAITVNVVQPGPTDTDMNPADAPRAAWIHGFMAIPGHGTSQDVASLVLYLAGPQAGGITGAMHTIDGGTSA